MEAIRPRGEGRIAAFIEAPAFGHAITVLIVLNAILLGLETVPGVMAVAGPGIDAADQAILAIFVVEIALRLYVHRLRFFRDPWSVFDFIVVGIALVPASQGLSVLRALRILRVLRLLSIVPRLRQVVEALLGAIPGLSAIVGLLTVLYYVFAVMATNLFGADFPQWFGNIGRSMYTLFQVMTLESWSMGIVRPIMEQHPYAWLFFVPFILIATFTVLNLFIAIIVNSMQSLHDAEQRAGQEATEAAVHQESEQLIDEIRQLRAEVRALRERR